MGAGICSVNSNLCIALLVFIGVVRTNDEGRRVCKGTFIH
jgi:molybdopterin synthase catalytic subunit